jgi:uncharacterized protein YdeI (YjbR/CyaY-like superfamily)
MSPSTTSQVISFHFAKEGENWLANHHATSEGIWLQIFRRSSGVKGITYEEARDEALCYGWIGGRSRSDDEKSWLRRFTPRRPKSIWSKGNIAHVARLMKAKQVKLAGLKQVEALKADGPREKAYDFPKTTQLPENLLKQLAKNKKPKEFFKTWNRANTYAIAWRLHTAQKLGTRERRTRKFLEMMASGEKLHPERMPFLGEPGQIQRQTFETGEFHGI